MSRPLNMSMLRAELIAAMRGARSGELPVDRAQAVAALAQATVELLQAELRFRELCVEYRKHGWRFGLPVGAMRVLLADSPEDRADQGGNLGVPRAMSDEQLGEILLSERVAADYDKGLPVAALSERYELPAERVREILVSCGIEEIR